MFFEILHLNLYNLIIFQFKSLIEKIISNPKCRSNDVLNNHFSNKLFKLWKSLVIIKLKDCSIKLKDWIIQ